MEILNVSCQHDLCNINGRCTTSDVHCAARKWTGTYAESNMRCFRNNRWRLSYFFVDTYNLLFIPLLSFFHHNVDIAPTTGMNVRRVRFTFVSVSFVQNTMYKLRFDRPTVRLITRSKWCQRLITLEKNITKSTRNRQKAFERSKSRFRVRLR